MQVSVETIEGLERRMTVTIPADKVDGEMARRFDSLSKTAQLKGFRPGKVPLKVIKGHYGSQVEAEVLDEITRNSFYEAVGKEKLRLAGYPAFDVGTVKAGEGFSYTAIFEVMSEFELASLDDIAVSRPQVTLAEADVDAMLAKLQRQSCRWNLVDRAAQAGDRLTMDFTGTLDGQPFAGGDGTDVPVVLGSNAMIAGFEEGLTGSRADEERTLDLAFPDAYHNQELAGQKVVFSITVKRVEEAELPDIDEDFARAYEIDDGNLDTLRVEIQRSMQAELDEAIRLKVKAQVMDALFDRHTLELPRSQVDAMCQNLMKQRRIETPDAAQLADLTAVARRNVALGIILNRVIKARDLKPDALKVRARVEAIAAGYDDSDAVIAWYYGDRDRLADVEAVVLEDAVVESVIAKAQVTDVPSSFESVVGGDVNFPGGAD